MARQTAPNASEVLRGNLNNGFLTVSVLILVGSILWLICACYLGRDTQRAATQLDDHPQLS